MSALRLRLDNLCIVVVIFIITSPTQAHADYQFPVHSLTTDGVWTAWTSWSNCSRPCGPGISSRSRDCETDINKRINSEDNPCSGVTRQIKVCNTQPCARGRLDSRAEMCAVFNGKPFRRRRYRWTPFINPRNRCDLTCRAVGFQFYSQFAKTVPDGTPCKKESAEICLAGDCVPVGCDGVVESDARLDKCRVCRGDNSSCNIISGIFAKPRLKYGYNSITTIPVGATNINITEVRLSQNYLVLKAADGGNILNALWRISYTGHYKGAGTVFNYDRRKNSSCRGECLYATGPLTEPVELLVLYYYRNKGILYEYSLPRNSSKRNTTVPENSKIQIELSTVKSTSVNVGTNPTSTTTSVLPSHIRTTTKQTLSKSSEHIGQKIANINKSNFKIERIPKKKSRMPKYSQSFTFNKHYMKMKKMRLLTRGKHGNVSKSITVSENSHNGNRLISKIPDANKSNSHDGASGNSTNDHRGDIERSQIGQNTKIIPDSGVDYHAKILNKHIVQTKGTRDLHKNASFSTLVNASRIMAPPVGEEGGISSGEEITRDLSEEKTPQYTTVGERGFNLDVVSTTQSIIKKMTESKKNNYNAHTYAPLGSYSTTSSTAKAIGEHSEGGAKDLINYGTNTNEQENEQTGVVYIPASTNLHGPVVSDRNIGDPSSANQGNEEDSFESLWPEVPSSNTGNQSPWPEVPSSNTGNQSPNLPQSNVHHLPNREHQYVANSNIGSVRTSDVLPNKKHSNTIENTNDLSSASDKLEQNEFNSPRLDNDQLGNSVEIEDPPPNPVDRHVIQNVPGRHVISAYRHQQKNHNNIQDPNYSWRIHGFTECTETCGGGTQETLIVCVKRNSQVTVMDEDCDASIKPNSHTVACNTSPCPSRWESGEWTACSATCGNGIQTRAVKCTLRISMSLTLIVPIDSCSEAEQPETTRICNTQSCFWWNATDWSECSAECGRGMKHRRVTCMDHNGEDVTSVRCTASRPISDDICDMGSCARGWFYTAWPKNCTAECGDGELVRNRHCSSDKGATLPDNKCDKFQKPEITKHCRSEIPCGGKWFTGPWSKCNTTCGRGFQKRDVVCLKKLPSAIVTVVSYKNCAEDDKPSGKAACEQPPCAPEWYMMGWGQCSQTCDTGFRLREVKCLDVHQRSSPNCEVDSKPHVREVCNSRECHKPKNPPPAKGCEDRFSRCKVVVQARMCRYRYYKKMCCSSCHNRT